MIQVVTFFWRARKIVTFSIPKKKNNIWENTGLNRAKNEIKEEAVHFELTKIISNIENIVKYLRFGFEFVRLKIFNDFNTLYPHRFHHSLKLTTKQLQKMNSFAWQTEWEEQKKSDIHFKFDCFSVHIFRFWNESVRTDTIPSCCLCLLQKQMKTARRIPCTQHSHAHTFNTCSNT